MNFQWHFSTIPAPYNYCKFSSLSYHLYPKRLHPLQWLFYLQMIHKAVFPEQTAPVSRRHAADCNQVPLQLYVCLGTYLFSNLHLLNHSGGMWYNLFSPTRNLGVHLRIFLLSIGESSLVDHIVLALFLHHLKNIFHPFYLPLSLENSRSLSLTQPSFLPASIVSLPSFTSLEMCLLH